MRLPALLAVLLLTGCLHPEPVHRTAKRDAPSVERVDARITSAQGHAAAIGTHASAIASNEQRIDDKATLLIRHFRHQ